MAWPPPTLPTTRTNTTVMTDTHPAEHNAVNLAINDIVAQINAAPWTNIALFAGWSLTGAQFDPVSYRKIGDIVYVRGMITGTTNQTAAFALPIGFRPLRNINVVVAAAAAVPPATTAFVAINPSNGQVTVFTTYLAATSMDFHFSIT